MTCYVYAFYEPDGTCFYVGKGSGDRHRRNDRRNAHFKAIIAIHGENVVKRILHDGLTDEAALELEVKLIGELKPRANKTSGGEGICGYTHTESALRRTGDAQKLLWADPVYKAKMRAAHSGKKLTQEQKDHLGNMHRGMVRPAGTGEKIAASKRGKPRSAETRAKLSLAQTGKKLSDETRTKMRAAHARRKALGCATTTGNQ